MQRIWIKCQSMLWIATVFTTVVQCSGGSRIWPREGPTYQRGPGGPLKLWWAPSIFEGQRGPFEASDAQRAHYELRRPPQAAQRVSSDAQRAPLWAQRVPQEVSESFQSAPKYLLKISDNSLGHSKGSFGSRKGPSESSREGPCPHAPPPPLDPPLVQCFLCLQKYCNDHHLHTCI